MEKSKTYRNRKPTNNNSKSQRRRPPHGGRRTRGRGRDRKGVSPTTYPALYNYLDARQGMTPSGLSPEAHIYAHTISVGSNLFQSHVPATGFGFFRAVFHAPGTATAITAIYRQWVSSGVYTFKAVEIPWSVFGISDLSQAMHVGRVSCFKIRPSQVSYNSENSSGFSYATLPDSHMTISPEYVSKLDLQVAEIAPNSSGHICLMPQMQLQAEMTKGPLEYGALVLEGWQSFDWVIAVEGIPKASISLGEPNLQGFLTTATKLLTTARTSAELVWKACQKYSPAVVVWSEKIATTARIITPALGWAPPVAPVLSAVGATATVIAGFAKVVSATVDANDALFSLSGDHLKDFGLIRIDVGIPPSDLDYFLLQSQKIDALVAAGVKRRDAVQLVAFHQESTSLPNSRLGSSFHR